MFGLPPELLHAVAESPEDDTPRLACADWLDEHGEPDAAAYIRAEVRRAALEWRHADPRESDRLKSRGRSLWRAHGTGWLGPVAGLMRRRADAVHLWRGFADKLDLSGPFTPEELAALARVPMAECLLIRNLGGRLDGLAGLGLRNLRALTVYWPKSIDLEWADLEPLLACERLSLPSLRFVRVAEIRDRLTARWDEARAARLPTLPPAERERVALLRPGWRKDFSRETGVIRLERGGDRLRTDLACLASLGRRGRAVSVDTALFGDDLSAVRDAQVLHVRAEAGGPPPDRWPAFPEARAVQVSGPSEHEPDTTELFDWLATMPRLASLTTHWDHLSPAGLARLPALRTLSVWSPPADALRRLRSATLVELHTEDHRTCDPPTPEDAARLPALRASPAGAEPVGTFVPWFGEIGGPLALEVPAELGDSWREWGNDADEPHAWSPAVLRVWAVPRELLPDDPRERLLDGDSLTHAASVANPETLAEGVTAMAWRGPQRHGLRALAVSADRAVRLELAWGSRRARPWGEAAKRVAASLRLG